MTKVGKTIATAAGIALVAAAAIGPGATADPSRSPSVERRSRGYTVTYRGTWVAAGCVIHEIDADPATGRSNIHCYGTGELTGELDAHATEDIRLVAEPDGSSVGHMDEWLYARTKDNLCGGIRIDESFTIGSAARGGPAHGWGTVTEGTGDFAGVTGHYETSGVLVGAGTGGYTLTLTFRAKPVPASTPCLPPVPPPPPDPGPPMTVSAPSISAPLPGEGDAPVPGEPGTDPSRTTQVSGAWEQEGCIPTSASPDGHFTMVCHILYTGTWNGHVVEYIEGDLAADGSFRGINEYFVYGRAQEDNTCGSLHVIERVEAAGPPGFEASAVGEIVSGTGDWEGSRGRQEIAGIVVGGPGFGGYSGTWIRPRLPSAPAPVPCVPPRPELDPARIGLG